MIIIVANVRVVAGSAAVFAPQTELKSRAGRISSSTLPCCWLHPRPIYLDAQAGLSMGEVTFAINLGGSIQMPGGAYIFPAPAAQRTCHCISRMPRAGT